MSIVIDGTGSITGLSAGGLPDNSITTNDIAANAITEAKLATGLYACKAWVNFNGTGTVAIRSSGNVSSITDNGTGTYTINMATALPDANYSIQATGRPSTDRVCNGWIPGPAGTYGDVTTTSFPLRWADQTPSVIDPDIVCVAVFR